ncbi:MAG: tetratricopeptide repeat protein [Deltaproteobacteria bacterium]|nr:tetratricopeptide repeat protein [Deltaproteobacteria bacterium]
MTPEQSCGRRDFRVHKLIGREAEKRGLYAALDRAVRFEAPQFVTLVGSAGMGKTRLLAEWLKEVAEKGEFRCVRVSAVGANEGAEAMGLVGRLLRARIGIGAATAPVAAVAQVRAELQAVFGDRRVSEIAGLLGGYMGLEGAEGPLVRSLAMRPEQQSDLSRAVLCRFLEEDARYQPALYVIDDGHLADGEALDLLQRLRTDLGEAPLVFVVAARPELYVRQPNWSRVEGSHVRLDLGPLAPLEMEVFVLAALAAESLAPGLAERAALESGGNPLLLGELLAAYYEHGILACDTRNAWWFDGDRAEREGAALCPELRAAARVAELSPSERELLARAAAMGSIFWTGGLVALGRLGAEPWDPSLVFAPDPSIEETKRMVALLAERGYLKKAESSYMGDDTAWCFVDADERVLVESTVDPEITRRRKCFAAQWLEARASKPPTGWQLENIAVLYDEGGDPRRASLRFIAAADEANRLQDYERARSLYTRAVRLLEADESLLKMEVLHKLGDVAARLGHSHEALAHFGDMLKAAWCLDLPGKGGAAHSRIGRIYRALGDYRMAVQHLDMAHLLFDLGGDRPGVAASLDDIGRVYYLVGKPDEALRCHRAALAIRVELGDERGKALTLAWIGLVEAQMGKLGLAQQSFERALAISQATKDPHGIVFSLLDLGALTREAGHPKLAHRLLSQARDVSRTLGDRLTECHLALQIGDCLLAQGEHAAAEQEMHAARRIAQKFGARRLQAEADRGLAEISLARGDFLAARDHAAWAAGEAEKMGAAPLVGTALRVLGTALAAGAPGDSDRGGPREVFDRAVELLGSSGAELELGRAFCAYADFEERIGRQAAAEELRDRACGIRRSAGLHTPGREVTLMPEATLQ